MPHSFPASQVNWEVRRKEKKRKEKLKLKLGGVKFE
jgi:hypothetical protein